MRYRMTFVVGVLGLVVPLMYGQTMDPSTLHIGHGVGLPCDQGCAGEPNLLGTTGLVDIYQQSGGANTINSGSLLLILAVPNTVTFTAPASATETDYDSSGTLINETSPAATLQTTTGTLSATSSSSDVYGALGLPSVTPKSDNFTNLTGATGIPTVDSSATSFTIYEYLVTGSSLEANGYAQFQFSSLPVGVYAFGYGCQGTSATLTANCTNNPNPYDTPFTESGLEDGPPSTPEPTAVILLGSSMIGVGALVRRRRSRVPKSV